MADKERIEALEHLKAYKEGLSGLGIAGKQVDVIFKQIAEHVSDAAEFEKTALDQTIKMIDAAGKVLTAQETIGGEKRKEVKINDKLFGTKERILKAVTDEGKRQKIVTDEIIKQRNSTNEAYNKLQGFLKGIPVIGSSLASTFDVIGPYVDKYNEFFAKSLPKAVDGAEIPLKARMKAMGGAIGKTVGIAAAGGMITFLKKGFDTMREMGLSAGQTMGLGFQVFFGEELKAITAEFGSINDSSLKLVSSMKWFSFWTGTSTADLAKTLGLMSATSSLTTKQLMDQINITKEMAQQAGIPMKAIMSDIAGNAEFVAKFSKDGGMNIAMMALHAKKLGVSLSEVSTVASSLLNFESSIEAQMQAQVLLGRNINMDKARQLAFTGKHSEMMDEVLRQVGDEAGWNKMNYLERESIAGLVGLSADKMGNLIREEKQAVAAANEMRQKWLGIATAAGAVVGMIVGGLTLGVGLPAAIAAMGGGAIAGGAIGRSIAYLTTVPAKETPRFQNLRQGQGVSMTRGTGITDAGETTFNTIDIEKGNRKITDRLDTMVSILDRSLNRLNALGV